MTSLLRRILRLESTLTRIETTLTSLVEYIVNDNVEAMHNVFLDLQIDTEEEEEEEDSGSEDGSYVEEELF